MSNICVSYKESIVKEAGGIKQISFGIAFKTDNSNEIPKEELYSKTLNNFRNMIRKELKK